MVIGVYGIGYWIASWDANTHWPIVLIGLLGKVFGPIGFVYSACLGDLPWSMGWTILTNDVAWWLPFSAILLHAARIHEANRTSTDGLTLEQALRNALTQDGKNLFDLSTESPLLLVCVRHLGCAFCREMLADLSNHREELKRTGLTPVVVSMGTHDQAASMLTRFGLRDVLHVSDPDRYLYRTLELPFGTLGQLFGWSAVWRALVEGALFKFGSGRIIGNALQLSGAFVIKNGRIVQAIRHRSSSERTDFSKLSCDIG
jgi:peroxiredoxin